MPEIHGHIILTSGAKPNGPIHGHGPARQQVLNLLAFAERQNLTVVRLTYDHARSVGALSSFSVLVQCLQALRDAGKGIVFIDDLNRLLRTCAPEKRAEILVNLAEFGDHLFPVRQGRIFSKITVNELDALQLNPDRARWSFATKRSRLPETERLEQTKKAVIASRASRAVAADDKARQISAVKNDLEKTRANVSFAAIAEEANRRGLTTTRGNPWSGAGVSRGLQRLDAGKIRGTDAVEGNESGDTHQGS